jgi:hypothetical protein
MKLGISMAFVIALVACGKDETAREADDLVSSAKKYREDICKCSDLDCLSKHEEGLAIVIGGFGRLDPKQVPEAKQAAFSEHITAATQCQTRIREGAAGSAAPGSAAPGSAAPPTP